MKLNDMRKTMKTKTILAAALVYALAMSRPTKGDNR